MPARGQVKLIVEAGQVFGRLKVIRNLRRYRKAEGDIRYRVLCRCQCGRKTRVSKFELLRGETRSCGCLATELIAKRNQEQPWKTHGATSKNASPALRRTFGSWKAMRSRCLRATDPYFHRYGGHGVKICKRWLKSFAAFVEDLGLRGKNETLGRFRDKGDYRPGNCRWVSVQEQAASKRRHEAQEA